ncbi:MAG TPA: hypothetical protein VGF77_03880 [Allosphingosinicella sp.]
MAAILAAAMPAAAQQPARPAQAPAAAPAPVQAGVPDSLTVDKLIWSTMAAVDQANQTGNYSVLRDLGAPGFQANNNAATLGTIFTNLRNQRVDLGYTLVLVPTLQFPPTIVQGGLLRLRGVFPLRPNAIGFDLLFQNVSGQWKIFGIAIAPLVLQSQPSPAIRR